MAGRGRDTRSILGTALRVLVVLCVLFGCTAVFAAEHGGVHGGEHGYPPEMWWNLLWRTMNFAALALALGWALKKPLSKALADRQASIKQKFEELETQKTEVERLYAEHERTLSTIEEEGRKVLQEYIDQGKAEKERIIQEATKAAELIRKQAGLAVEQEVKRAKLMLRTEVAEHSVRLAADLIQKNLDQSDHQRLIDDYIAKVVHKN